MPFVSVTTIRPATVGTGISATMRKRGANGKTNLVINITSDMMKTLQLATGDKIEAMVGTEKEHGLILFRKTENGSEIVIQEKLAKGSYWFFELGTLPQFADEAQERLWCTNELLEGEDEFAGWVQVVLPKWADKTHPLKKQVMDRQVESQADHNVDQREASRLPAMPPLKPGEQPANSRPQQQTKQVQPVQFAARKPDSELPPHLRNVPPRGGNGKRNVTAAAMGDPDPNRPRAGRDF